MLHNLGDPAVPEDPDPADPAVGVRGGRRGGRGRAGRGGSVRPPGGGSASPMAGAAGGRVGLPAGLVNLEPFLTNVSGQLEQISQSVAHLSAAKFPKILRLVIIDPDETRLSGGPDGYQEMWDADAPSTRGVLVMHSGIVDGEWKTLRHILQHAVASFCRDDHHRSIQLILGRGGGIRGPDALTVAINTVGDLYMWVAEWSTTQTGYPVPPLQIILESEVGFLGTPLPDNPMPAIQIYENQRFHRSRWLT